MREALHPVVANGADLREAVLGVASLLLWALILIVTLKYVVLPDARRQQGRRRHPVARRAGRKPARQEGRRRAGARHHRRGLLLRRRDDHAGHVGALRRRRPQGGEPPFRALCRAADAGHPDHAVPVPVQGHGRRRLAVRADHAGVVRDARHHRRLPPHRRSRDLQRLQPDAWHRHADRPAGPGAPGVRRRVPVGDGRRGALCRHGPFRRQADPHGMALRRVPRHSSSTILARAPSSSRIRRR